MNADDDTLFTEPSRMDVYPPKICESKNLGEKVIRVKKKVLMTKNENRRFHVSTGRRSFRQAGLFPWEPAEKASELFFFKAFYDKLYKVA